MAIVTQATKLLGITHPIVLAPMGGVAGGIVGGLGGVPAGRDLLIAASPEFYGSLEAVLAR